MKNIFFFFLSENFIFLVVKFSIYLNRRVLLMGKNLEQLNRELYSSGTQPVPYKFWRSVTI